MAFGHLLGDRPQVAVLLPEAALILSQEPVKIMEKYPEFLILSRDKA